MNPTLKEALDNLTRALATKYECKPSFINILISAKMLGEKVNILADYCSSKHIDVKQATELMRVDVSDICVIAADLAGILPEKLLPLTDDLFDTLEPLLVQYYGFPSDKKQIN